MRKFICLMFIGVAYADCDFIVTNNSSSRVVVEAGFFNKNNESFAVEPARSDARSIKGDYNCTDITPSGLGVSYVNLIGGKSSGGWVYDTVNKVIRANGASAASATGRIGVAPNGVLLWLPNNAKPENGVFNVEIKNIQRNVSRQFGSMD